MGDDGVSGLEDGVGGAVVLFESDDLGAGEEVFEVEDIAEVGASPAVDGLVVVADDADIGVRSGEHDHESELYGVGVLVFVDEDVAALFAVGLEDIGAEVPEFDGESEEVIEVDEVHLLESLLIESVDEGDVGGSGEILEFEVCG